MSRQSIFLDRNRELPAIVCAREELGFYALMVVQSELKVARLGTITEGRYYAETRCRSGSRFVFYERALGSNHECLTGRDSMIEAIRTTHFSGLLECHARQ